MPDRRIGLIIVLASLVACQDADTPAGPRARSDAAAAAVVPATGSDWIFRFERMDGNDVTGANGRIRNQNALGAPWRLDAGDARLSKRGELRVTVSGLVLKATGVNPIAAFRAILSCLTNDASTTPATLATVDIPTALVPAGTDGSFEIRETLAGIPAPCYAPIVFVTNANGGWGAIAGF